MKYLIIIISAGILVAVFGVIQVVNENKYLKSDLNHLKNTIDITVDKAINDAKKEVTDSLLNEFNQRKPIKETKIKIQYKYEKIIDTIYLMPSSEQLDYVTNELNRLYPNH